MNLRKEKKYYKLFENVEKEKIIIKLKKTITF